MLKGVFAPIPTPFDRDENIYYRGLEKNLARWSKSALAGLVVAGTNGEAAYLDHKEKIALFAYAREHFPAEKLIIAGTGCESARATIKLNREAAGAGVDALLVITPNYYKSAMNDDALYDFYLNVAEGSPLPIILYNMPRNTGVNISAALACRLSHHTNIAGIKDSSGDIAQIQAIIEKAAPGFEVSAGSAGFLLPAMFMGAVGGTAALANIIPAETVNIASLFEDGRLEEARRLQLALLQLNAAVTSRFGVPALKYALELVGLYGGPPRAPLAPASEEVKKCISEMLDSLAQKGIIDFSY